MGTFWFGEAGSVSQTRRVDAQYEPPADKNPVWHIGEAPGSAPSVWFSMLGSKAYVRGQERSKRYCECIDLATGKDSWRFAQEGDLGGIAGVWNDELLIVPPYGLDPGSGEVKLELPDMAQPRKLSEPMIHGALLLCGWMREPRFPELYCYDLAAGREVPCAIPPEKPVPQNGIVYACLRDRLVYGDYSHGIRCVSLPGFDPQWRVQLPDTRSLISCYQITLDGDRCHVNALDGAVWSIDIATGEVVWQADLNAGTGPGQGVLASLAAAPDMLYVSGGLKGNGQIVALSADDGREVWRFKCRHEAGEVMPCIVAGNQLYGETDGLATVWDRYTGDIVWQGQGPGTAFGMGLCDGWWLLSNLQGEMICYRLEQ